MAHVNKNNHIEIMEIPIKNDSNLNRSMVIDCLNSKNNILKFSQPNFQLKKCSSLEILKTNSTKEEISDINKVLKIETDKIHSILPNDESHLNVNKLEKNESTNDTSNRFVIIHNKIENNLYTKIIIILLTIFLLFINDFRKIFIDKKNDKIISIMVLLIIIVFVCQLILNTIYKKRYLLTITGIIDILSILSMFFDIHWIYEYLMSNEINYVTDSTLREKINKSFFTNHSKLTFNITYTILFVSKAMILLKLIQFVINTFRNPVNEDSKAEKLIDLTTIRVIIIVIFLEIIFVILEQSLYIDQDTSINFGLELFNNYQSFNQTSLSINFDIFFDFHEYEIISPILYLRVANISQGNNSFDLLRPEERLIYFKECLGLIPNSDGKFGCYALFDNSNLTKFQSILNIIKTSLISIILFFGSYAFFIQIKNNIIRPIIKITKKINFLIENPSKAMKKMESDKTDKKTKTVGRWKAIHNFFYRKIVPPYEIKIIDKTVSNISALLSQGIGKSGSQLITKFNDNNDSDARGNRIMAIYSLCDLKNFTDKLESFHHDDLQVFNEIAEIIHSYFSRIHGIVNKNVGDSFFLIYKFSDNLIYNDNLKECSEVTDIIEMSITQILKIIIEISKSKKLNDYITNSKNINIFQINFGLNIGWSI